MYNTIIHLDLSDNCKKQVPCNEKEKICDSMQYIERYQLSKDWILSYGDAKSKYLKI